MSCCRREVARKLSRVGGLFTVLSAAFLAPAEPILFGSALDADQQVLESQQLAKDVLAAPNPQRRAKGDQHRTYNFRAAKKEMPYRLYVPTTWDGRSSLPLVGMLHGAGSDENRYIDMNNKQIIRLACGERRHSIRPWRVDETYVRVPGNCVYLYRAVDSAGDTIDFMLSLTRDLLASKHFLQFGPTNN